MRFPRHAERQGIAPESKFAEKKKRLVQEKLAQSLRLKIVRPAQLSEKATASNSVFQVSSSWRLGTAGLQKKLLGQASFFSISIQIFMHFVFMLFHIATNKIQPQVIQFKPRPTHLDHPMEPPLFRSNADEANAAAPSFHKELEELNLNFILTLVWNMITHCYDM